MNTKTSPIKIEGELQNITGEINAIFPADPDGLTFLRAPYHSQRIQSLRIGSNELTRFSTSSGAGTINQGATGDHRTLSFNLKEGIKSGTYLFPGGAGNELQDVVYGEIANVEGSYNLQNLTPIEATLELEVSTDGRHLTAKRFDMTVKTHKEVTLTIKADFDIYLAIE